MPSNLNIKWTPQKNISSKPKISIGIPLYDTEKYLEKCLKSVLSQSLNDFELILVDDCSPDNSIKIAHNYQKKDKRIKVIRHDKNLGLGGARNTFINNAIGEYIGFVDSDDFIDTKMFEVLYNRIIADRSDIAVCGYNLFNKDYVIFNKRLFQQKIVERAENDTFLGFWLRDNSFINVMTWNKLYKKSIFLTNKIHYPDYVYHQDFATTPRLLHFANRISFCEGSHYYWLNRIDSVTYTIKEKRCHDNFEVFNILKNFLIEHDLYEKHKACFYKTCLQSIKFNVNKAMAISQNEDLLIKYYSLYIKKILTELSIKEIVSILGASTIQKIINI